MPEQTAPSANRWRVPYIRPTFPAATEIATDVDSIVASNWYTNFGPYERRFAAALSAYVGDRPFSTASNATVGLMAALRLLVPRRGLVLVPSYTFAAGPAAIRWAGHEPLFIDVDPTTIQPSLASARAAIGTHGDRVVGILLGNSFGIGNAEIEAWERLAADEGLPLVVDSAAGFGSEYADGRKVGVAGDCEVFSFHATKPFAIGEGGGVAWRTEEDTARARSFFNFGFVDHDAVMLGLNGKLQELNAAIGLRQLERLPAALASRRATLARYASALTPHGLVFPEGQDRSSVCAAFVLAESEGERDAVLAELHRSGVEARVYYSPAVHLQPQYADALAVDDLSGTHDVCSRVIAVPVHEDMAEDAVECVIESVRRVLPPR